jgi:hypothetical protein
MFAFMSYGNARVMPLEPMCSSRRNEGFSEGDLGDQDRDIGSIADALHPGVTAR